MKLLGLSAFGILSGLVFGYLGSHSFMNASRTPAARSNNVGAELGSARQASDDTDTRRQDSVSDSGLSDGTNESVAEATLRAKIERLERGKAFVERMGEYTAKIQKQEVVGHELLDEQTILIKCRQKPFSVYLNWLTGDTGREVLFIDGQNNGKMIAHDGGWKARIPAFSLSPDCQLAMRDARYPVTSAGLVGLIDTMRDVHLDDLRSANFATCVAEEQKFDGRRCDKFTTTYQSSSASPVYRKSVTLIDREWNVPLQSRHFEWPRPGTHLSGDELDDATLIESYNFTEIRFQPGLSNRDFDRKNPEYRFR